MPRLYNFLFLIDALIITSSLSFAISMFEIVLLRSNIFKNGDRRTRARKNGVAHLFRF
jgi:hypothetical protein